MEYSFLGSSLFCVDILIKINGLELKIVLSIENDEEPLWQIQIVAYSSTLQSTSSSNSPLSDSALSNSLWIRVMQWLE